VSSTLTPGIYHQHSGCGAVVSLPLVGLHKWR